ncbi:MAG: glycosyltransferase [Pyrinomonadaceae bacterium]|nr:glycosyltransferase [Pyrinomonadaceae bacterium]
MTIVDTLSEGDSPVVQSGDMIERVRIKPTHSSLIFPQVNRFRNLRTYNNTVRHQMALGPNVVIAFEPEAACVMLKMKKKGLHIKRVVHLHEMPDPDAYAESLGASWALAYLRKNLSLADAVILPDRDRAEYIQSNSSLKTPPLVVMNCPRRLAELPASLLLPFLRERGIDSSRIVHYQGAVGPDHKLETVIKSMRFWPADSVFVIVGAGRKWYLKKLTELTAAEGVAHRVIFAGRIPYDQLFQYAIGASVGVTLLDPSGLNTKLCAGAGNKRFEYAALGIPQVTNDGPGIQGLFGDTGIAAIANHNDVSEIGQKISHYLTNEAFARDAGAKARAIHLQSYNYEHQFQKVLEFIG